MLLNDGALDGQRILGRRPVELMTANHLSMPPLSQSHALDSSNGGGFGAEVPFAPGRGHASMSIGRFGWYGAATTYCQIDPREKIVAIALAQHFPFNEHGLFNQWQTAYYQALK